LILSLRFPVFFPSKCEFFSSFYLTIIEKKFKILNDFLLQRKWFALLISRALAFSEFSLRKRRN